MAMDILKAKDNEHVALAELKKRVQEKTAVE
ncbi:MAG TPA: nucleotidyltransferase domain-containing protein, partial [Firmicutes bacterium]|nr:nucleotidyltransferase domain-containing protein [Bacillota bacterium]